VTAAPERRIVAPVQRADWEHRLVSVLGVPAVPGNSVEILRNGDEIFPAMLDAIGAATRTVDIVTFVYWSGTIAEEFASALSAASERGCRVRVLLDAVGARRTAEELVEQMTGAGCDVRWFRPIVDGKWPEIGDVNHRTHRKILVCDGAVGFTGGVGIADEWRGDARDETEWRDTHLRVTGPVVAGLQAGFIDNWADQASDDFEPSAEVLVATAETGTVDALVLRGSSEVGANDIWRMMLTLICCAERRVRIASAYFSPDDRLQAALVDAVGRGVVVQVLVPGEHADKRFVRMAGESLYQDLLDAGVAICTFDPSMMHAKIFTVDGAVAAVGSANFNGRSTQLDEESMIVLLDEAVVRELDAHFDEDLSRSSPLDPADWAERGLLQRVGERVSQTVDRLL
jgi:cardiolipin synthase